VLSGIAPAQQVSPAHGARWSPVVVAQEVMAGGLRGAGWLPLGS